MDFVRHEPSEQTLGDVSHLGCTSPDLHGMGAAIGQFHRDHLGTRTRARPATAILRMQKPDRRLINTLLPNLADDLRAEASASLESGICDQAARATANLLVYFLQVSSGMI